MNAANTISPADAQILITAGARLFDIREADERDQVIPEAGHLALSGLRPDAVSVDHDQPVIFHCRSGRRTTMNAQRLRATTSAPEVYLLEGGFDAWAAAGLPIQIK
ncbi:hypothetical protein ABAC460_16185 [Asticcacaulis sp. AC460]|uniref:rhodanese-like domain-containing protein n=1 Tax=Asticcacaulis sp. AC460 TaxID=1282360 RepID=UPI0003C3C81A|nr:rhodanese-like domain-containing protein [Asticcacaulis sp. AC460]ESQ88199.1 hypothetical protein ABAC460_16185 [Asticcacaulis sp. AC460]